MISGLYDWISASPRLALLIGVILAVGWMVTAALFTAQTDTGTDWGKVGFKLMQYTGVGVAVGAAVWAYLYFMREDTGGFLPAI